MNDTPEVGAARRVVVPTGPLKAPSAPTTSRSQGRTVTAVSLTQETELTPLLSHQDHMQRVVRQCKKMKQELNHLTPTLDIKNKKISTWKTSSSLKPFYALALRIRTMALNLFNSLSSLTDKILENAWQ